MGAVLTWVLRNNVPLLRKLLPRAGGSRRGR